MIVTPGRAAAAFLLASAFASCAPETGTAGGGLARKTPATLGAKDVVAEVDGAKITLAELDAHAAGELQQVRDQEYEVRRRALDDLVVQRLLKKEAASRGITEKELMKQEVEAKVPSPTPEEIQTVYDINRDRVGGRTREEIAPQIASSLVQQRLQERARAFTGALRDSATVRITLEQPRTDVVVPEGVASLGPANAPVTIVEYSDYLCPYCQKAEEALAKVLARHQGKVKFIHRDYLLGRPRSMAVAKAALCAGDQGRFWEYRSDLLTTTGGDWSDTDLEGRAARLGVKTDDFRACLASDKHDQFVLDSSEEGRKLGVSGTPTFFVNGRRLTGVRSEADLDEVIRAELARQG